MKNHFFTNEIIKRRNVRKTLQVELLAVLFIIFVILFSVTFLFSSYQLKVFAEKVPKESEIISKVSEKTENSKIYDRNGVVLYEFKDPNQDREYVHLEEIPPELIWILLSAEDINFYNHDGIDFGGIIRSLDIYISSEGEVVVGGSTITQQLVKNTILTNEKTIERKAKEMFIAFLIETKYSKPEILEMYMNSISFGGNILGIKTAARTYFSKDLADLTFEEGVFLISLIQLPGQASPLFSSNEQLAWDIVQDRKNYIYERIIDNYNFIKRMNPDFIELKEIKSSRTNVISLNPNIGEIKAPHFVFYVKELLMNEPFNFSEEDLGNKGLEIHTSLDYKLQKIAEIKIKEGVEKYGYYGFSNASLVTLDPQNGEILAMVGSKDYFGRKSEDGSFDPYVNVALSDRNLGSSLKPFIAYKAFEQRQFTPYTVVRDEPINFDGYSPKNYDGRFMGDITVRAALIESRNIPFVKIIKKVGVEHVLALLEELGYKNAQYRSNYGLAIALGGFSSNLLEHTHGYSFFANNGQYTEILPIILINDSEGTQIYKSETSTKQLLNSKYVDEVNKILLEYGLKGIRGKTGTTDGNKDNYFIGYTSNFVTGIWTGNNNNKNMTRNAFGSTTALPIWNLYYLELIKEYPQYGV